MARKPVPVLNVPSDKAAGRRSRQLHRHHVYVVELADQVWNEPRFRKANPDYQLAKPFVYVGMTGLEPDLRFDKHKAGIQAKQFVFKHGLLRLLRGTRWRPKYRARLDFHADRVSSRWLTA